MSGTVEQTSEQLSANLLINRTLSPGEQLREVTSGQIKGGKMLLLLWKDDRRLKIWNRMAFGLKKMAGQFFYGENYDHSQIFRGQKGRRVVNFIRDAPQHLIVFATPYFIILEHFIERHA